MPTPETLQIGQLAARSGRTVHAIRWYEAQGLIPGVVRDDGGRRVYSVRHVNWLELMDRLRLTGMSIAQMREYTALFKQGRATLKERHALLRAHREKVREMIASWIAAEKLLEAKIDYYGEWLTTGVRPTVVFSNSGNKNSRKAARVLRPKK